MLLNVCTCVWDEYTSYIHINLCLLPMSTCGSHGIIDPLSLLTLLLSGTKSSLMRRLVPQSLASSSSAISCRWKTATWADRRLTLPLGVLSKSTSTSFCAVFSLTRSLSFSFSLSFSLASLSFSLGWLDGAFSCQSLFSGWLCSLFPPDGDSSETTWRSSKTLWVEHVKQIWLLIQI